MPGHVANARGVDLTTRKYSTARKAACVLFAGASGLSYMPTAGFAAATQAFADDYTYCYAGLSWAEYWANEGVYQAGNASSSEAQDGHGEYDCGGFDVVTRATTNHGLHRGSYQCNATIHATADDGTTKDFALATWSQDGKSFTTTSGETVGWSRGTCTTADGATYKMTTYNVYGTKYVPIKVKTSDYAAFKADREAKGFPVVGSGGTLAGGYSEGVLKSYSVTADVNANTYGLKTATKDASGFSFSKANESATQTGSGIAGQELKTVKEATDADGADGIKVMIGDQAGTNGFEPGAYGDFIRVDLGGDYGDLGANMQSVTWTYYGDDASGKKAVATYGTKFAADNWMHKSLHIQLGLTDSFRCQIPEGYDGSGYWTLTVHALGYKDYTTPVFKIGAENFSSTATANASTRLALQTMVDIAESRVEANYTAESWAALKAELDEAKELLEDADALQSEVSEQITHVNAAYEALEYKSGVKGNKITLKSKSATIKASAVKKKAQKATIKASARGKAKISYNVIGAPKGAYKKIAVNKAGKVTLKKGAKKGTYKVMLVTPEVKGYKAASNTFSVKVK